jgi:predicted ATPase
VPLPEPIGRERELAELVRVLEATAAGAGATVFVAGPAGSGKSPLLRALARTAGEREELRRVELVKAVCFETSAANPLGLFLEIMRGLASEDGRRTRAKRVLEVVLDVAPPLAELIPGVGALAALGVKSAAKVGVYALGGSHEALQAQIASDVALALRRIAQETPLAVVIDDAHWIDPPSTEVIARLAQADDAPLALIVAYDPARADGLHPLERARTTVASRGNVRRLVLEDLGPETLESVLQLRYGRLPHPRLAEWLHDRTDGTPLFLEEYLQALEAQGVLRREGESWLLDGGIEGGPDDWRLTGLLAGAQTPENVLDALRPQVADLGDEDRSLLESGAVQGKRFLTSVLVELLAQEEDAVLDRLSRLAEQRRLIASEAAMDWWSDRSALYTFDPGVLQELLYDRYARSPYEAQRRHRAVADALERLIEGDDPPPRHALLEIARHRELGRQPLLAARPLVDVAAAAYAEGADREAAALAERAAGLLDDASLEKLAGEERRHAHALLARAILLILLGGEPAWRRERSSGGATRLLALAGRAEAAAAESRDLRLQANARYATARIRTAHESLEAGLAAHREARALAQQAGDAVAELAILLDLGHHLDSQDLAAGRAVLEEAHRLLSSGAVADQLDERQCALEAARLESAIGVAEFDLGRYGDALRLLVQSSHALREARQRYEAAWALAFLAQVYTAIGLFEAAEAALGEGIGLFASDPAQLGTRGYLRALLGRLYVEWEPQRLEDARPELAAARAETLASGYRPVLPLVQTHWAELLVAEGTPEALDEADEVLAVTAREAAEFGWARSEIAAGSIRARVALARGRTAEAVALSTAAAEELERRGGAVPAVRSEEILYTHHLVLAAADAAGTLEPLSSAARTVETKAASLDDPAQRQSFLTRVRLSREILAAAAAAPSG